MLLVIAHTQDARQTLRNACRAHEGTVVRRFGRVVLLAETELGAFLACRLRERYGAGVQVERTRPFNEFAAVPPAVREAAAAYVARENPNTPYAKFAVGTDHPSPVEMRGAELDDAEP